LEGALGDPKSCGAEKDIIPGCAELDPAGPWKPPQLGISQPCLDGPGEKVSSSGSPGNKRQVLARHDGDTALSQC